MCVCSEFIEEPPNADDEAPLSAKKLKVHNKCCIRLNVILYVPCEFCRNAQKHASCLCQLVCIVCIVCVLICDNIA